MASDEPESPDAPGLAATGTDVAFGHFLVPRRADGSLWELGRGAMGVTYRAFDTSLKTEVALKVIHAERVQDEATRRRFVREARAAAKIRHPNIASVLFLGEQSGEFFYAMEFIAGRSLEEFLAENPGPLPPRVALGLAAQTVAALNTAHKREVLHRDLKPANLMLLENEALDHEDERTEAAGNRQIKIIDFGLARRFGAGRDEDSRVTHTGQGGFIGTPAYASPEQCAGDDDLDGRSDLYSLGIILWQMLVGQRPFTGNWVQVIAKHQLHAPPLEQLAGLPAPIVELLTGLLVKAPAQRQPQTTAELRALIDRLLRVLDSETGEAGSQTAFAAHFAAGTGADSATPMTGVESEAPAAGTGGTTVTPVVGSSLVSRYRLGYEATVGDGGRLFLAADNTLGGAPVALKLLSPERLAAESAFLSTAETALHRARRYPHPVLLVHTDGLQYSGESVFYVREWADGFPLDDLLRTRGALRATEVFRLLETLPSALDHAAASGFPWLSLALHKFFVVPLADKAGEDWPGLRTRPVEEWPNFALKLNPLDFPSASDDGTDHAERTQLDSPGNSAGFAQTPVAAFARLLRELLGGLPVSLAPLDALNGEANAVLRRAAQSDREAFATNVEFLAALRAAAAGGATIALPPPPTEPAEPSPLPAVPPAIRRSRWISRLKLAFRLRKSRKRRSLFRLRPAHWLLAASVLLLGALTYYFGRGSEGRNFRNAAGAEMVWIAPGTFMMGSPDFEIGRDPNEKQHLVTLTQGYWLGKFEVTQGLYQQVMEYNPSEFKNVGMDAPVEMVNFNDAHAFCAKLNAREQASGKLPAGYEYRLPTEAQWEYACRAGTTGPAYSMDANTPWKPVGGYYVPALSRIGWYGGHQGESTHPAGQRQPNAWGLYDMLGNVAEWCEDVYDAYPNSHVADPKSQRPNPRDVVSRGGSWSRPANGTRSASRAITNALWQRNDIGFRLALVPTAAPAPLTAAALASYTPRPAPPAAPPPARLPSEKDFRNAAGAEMVWIRPGNFTMGSPENEAGRISRDSELFIDPEKRHQVTLTQGYWLGKYEATQGLFQKVMYYNPSYFKVAGPDAPVENVTYDEADVFCAKLTELDRAAGTLPAGYEYRLPTEAQWEYACRAGTTGAVYGVDEKNPWILVKSGLGIDYAVALDDIATTGRSEGATTQPVGKKRPNAWGLYDMIGNVAEWCSSGYAEYPDTSVSDPPPRFDERQKLVVRGGSWDSIPQYSRAATRGYLWQNISKWDVGFRPALVSTAVPVPPAVLAPLPPLVSTPTPTPKPAPTSSITDALVPALNGTPPAAVPTAAPTPSLMATLVPALSGTPPAAVPPAEAWHVPGLNDASFGNWAAFNSVKLEARDGVLTLRNLARKRAGIASGASDFTTFDLHLELAASADVQAWIGIRRTRVTDDVYAGYTSSIVGRNGVVSVGHAGRNFTTATRAENLYEHEGGTGKADLPAEQFFTLDFTLDNRGILTTKVNGKTTSQVVREVPAKGEIALIVSTGSLRVRKLEVQRLP